MKTWLIKNYSNFTTTCSNKSFYDHDQPENHRKKKEKEEGVREKMTATVFCFYIVDFRQGKTHSLTFPQSNMVFINPARYFKSIYSIFWSLNSPDYQQQLTPRKIQILVDN